MKSIFAFFLMGMVMFAASFVKAADAPTNAASASVFAPIEFLVGGVWRAEVSGDTNDMKTVVEAKYAWTENHRGVRFDSTFVIGNQRRPYCSGVYFWNPEKREIELSYADSMGGLAEGPVEVEDAGLRYDLRLVDKSGKARKLLAKITRPDGKSYVSDVSMEMGGQMQKLLTVRYERTE